eukprot:766584-Hanusia_phi.AAC.6
MATYFLEGGCYFARSRWGDLGDFSVGRSSIGGVVEQGVPTVWCCLATVGRVAMISQCGDGGSGGKAGPRGWGPDGTVFLWSPGWSSRPEQSCFQGWV